MPGNSSLLLIKAWGSRFLPPQLSVVHHRVIRLETRPEGRDCERCCYDDPCGCRQTGWSKCSTRSEGRIWAEGRVRLSTITLVLFVHASLAYTSSAFINSENPIASSNPVVNEQRWMGFDLIVALNETFSMSLLFFVSGLFVWQSLARKGAWKYFGDRLKRLGLPLVIGVMFLIPLTYYPAQLEVGLISEKITATNTPPS